MKQTLMFIVAYVLTLLLGPTLLRWIEVSFR